MQKKTKEGIITASIMLAGLYLVYKIFKKTSNTNNVGIGVALEPSALGGAVGANPTMTQAEFKNIADKMFNAMSGWGTDTSVLYNNFALLKNNDDVMSLISSYGIRDLPSGKLNPIPDFGGNLPEALASELSQGEIDAINTTLSRNGINIRFNKDGKLTTM